MESMYPTMGGGAGRAAEAQDVVAVSRETLHGGKRAVDIEAFLVWVYKLQLAHLVMGWGAPLQRIEASAAGITLREVSRDGIAALARTLDTGAVVSLSPRSARGNDLHPDAEAAHRVVQLLPARAAALVVRHASAGTRPTWLPDNATRFEPVWKAGPRRSVSGLPLPRSFLVRTEYDRSRNPISVYCPLVEVNPPDLIAQSRDVYAYWRESLSVLAAYLSASALERHHVRAPSAPATPWIETEPQTILRSHRAGA